MAVNDLIQIRKGTSAAWTSANPVLASGEPGYDLTNKIFKIGDGSSNWASLGSINLTSSNITDFGTATSGILPVKNIVAGSNITISSSSGTYTINSTASGVGGSSSTSIIEYSTVLNFPASGVGSTIYISTDTGRIYRWASTVYQELGPVSYAPVGSDSRWDLFLPAAPTGVTAIAGNAQATVSWTAPSVAVPVTDYLVQYSANSGSSWTTFADGTSTATSATVTGLTNGNSYVFRVAAVNGIGTGSYSSSTSSVIAGSDPYFSSVALLLHMDGSGATFTDSSSSPKTITVSANTTQSATQSKFGGKSAYFSSTSDSLSLADLALGTGDFTIEMWFLSTGNVQYSQLIGNESGGSGFTLLFNHDSSSDGRIAVYGGNQSPLKTTTGGWNDGNWHYVVLTKSSSTLRIYVDGTLQASSSDNTGNWSGTTMFIGRNNIFQPRNFPGYIDDVRITKGSGRGYTGATIPVPTAAFQNS